VLLTHAIRVLFKGIHLLAKVFNLLVRRTELSIFVFCFLLEMRKCSFKLSMEVIGVGFELCDVEA
jgi:hypothetical protein